MIHPGHFIEISRRWSVVWQIEREKVLGSLWSASNPIYPAYSRRGDSFYLIRDNTANAKRPLIVFERIAGTASLPELGVSRERVQYRMIVRADSMNLSGGESPWWDPEDSLDIACEILKNYFSVNKVHYYNWLNYDPSGVIGASVVREPHGDFWLRYTGDSRASEATELTQNKVIINFSLEEQK